MLFSVIKIHKRQLSAFLAVLMLFTYCICQPTLYGTASAYTVSDSTSCEIPAKTALPAKLTVVKGLSEVSGKISELSAKYDNELESARLIVKTGLPQSELLYLGAVEIIAAPDSVYIMQFDGSNAAAAALKVLENSQYTEYAEPDLYIEADTDITSEATPTEPTQPDGTSTPTVPTEEKYEYLSWGAEYMNVDKYSEYLISQGYNNEVTVAVVDSGFDLEHEFFDGKISKMGHDYVDNDSTPDDLTGHGSHTCGIIADLTYNLPNIKLYPIKILSKYNTALSSSIGYAIQEAANYGADIINLSLSCSSSTFINNSIKYAINKGSLIVFSAGNDSYFCTKCPTEIAAETDGILIVSSINSDGEFSDFSNFGKAIDIAAPGKTVNGVALGGGYTYKSGTSMSAPHIAAAAAMLKTEYPNATPKDLEVMLKGFVADQGEIGFDEYYGYGVPSLDIAVNNKLVKSSDAFYAIKGDCAELLRADTSSDSYTVAYSINGYPVTLISETAFASCTALKSITLPGTVTDISPKAFAVCTSLEKINVSDKSESLTSIDGVLYNKDISELIAYPCAKQDTDFTVPDSVVRIKAGAFSYCGNLQSITIGKNVSDVSEAPFFDCTSLSMIYTDSENPYYTSISGILYTKELDTVIKCPAASKVSKLNLPEGVAVISEYAFNGCTALTEIYAGNALLRIGDGAFAGCTGLALVRLGEGLQEIGEMAFYSCCAIAELDLPLSVTALGGCAFAECTSLKKAVLNRNLTKIKAGLFSNCTGLTDAEINTTSKNLSYRMFYNCKALVNVYIHDDVPALGNYMFYKCTALTDIMLPSALTLVPSACFSSCTSLKNVDIGSNVRSINSSAFSGCTSLKSIILPENLNTIGSKAFSSCTSLSAIILPDSVTELEKLAFYKCTGLKIFASGASTASIPELLLDSCTALEYVILSSDASYIDPTAFENCTALITVNVGYGNSHYGSVSGVLINKDTETLMLYPPQKNSLRFNIPDGIVNIADKAFANNGVLAQLTIPNSVKNVGSNCFLNVSSVTSLTVGGVLCDYTLAQLFPASVSKLEQVTITAETEQLSESIFAGCTSLKTVKLPQTLKSLGSGTFASCSSIESVTLPDGVIYIAEKAFYNCESLTTVNIPKSLKAIAPYTFYGCKSLKETVIPDGVEEIGEYAYNGCKALERLDIPSSVHTIGQYAFASCENLKSIQLSETLERLETGLFYCCYSLTEITLPDSVQYIAERTFLNCIRLKNVNIPYGIAAIEPSTFYGCSLLKSIILPDSVTTVKNRAFFNCKTLSDISLSANITSIDDKAFERCAALENIDLPAGITSLGTSVFSGCTSLKSIYIPDLIFELKNEVFKGCTSLTDIEGGNGILTVGKLAFSGCTALGDTQLSESITSIASNAFSDCSSLRLICKFGSYIHSYASENGLNYTVIYDGDGYTVSVSAENDVFTYFNMDKSENGTTTLYKVSAGNEAQPIKRGVSANITIPLATDTNAELYVISGIDNELETAKAIEYDIINGQYSFSLDCFDEISIKGGTIGDINLDGIYDINDLYSMLNISAQTEEPVSALKRLGDVNGDGAYNLLDAYTVLVQNNA